MIYIPLCFYLYMATKVYLSPSDQIYIPLCFYLYPFLPVPEVHWLFTFHYVSTYTARHPLRKFEPPIFTFHYVSTYTRSFFSLNPCRLPSSKLSISLFSSTSSSFFLLIFLLSSILLQKYALCRLPTVSALSQVDNHRKLLVLSSWMPQNSFGIHFSFRHLKIIKESLSSRMTLFNSIFSFRSCDSDISPSKTEF